MTQERAIQEVTLPGPEFARTQVIAWFVGGAGLAAATLLALFAEPTLQRFYFAYLVSYAFFLSLSLGAMFFVLLQHLTRAGWSVGIRRIGEIMIAGMPVLAALAAPIVISVILQKGDLYPWAMHPSPAEAGHAEHLAADKSAYLNAPFFLLRLAVYFAVWSVIGVWYWRKSVQQDATGDANLTSRMQALSAPAMIAFALTVTLAAFDLLMSLDPAWFSTIFGVYFFSGCAVGIFAAMVIAVHLLQSSGYLTRSITTEHYHDLGKFLFGFTFFRGYIAFSQYMLIWYGNIPEEVGWFIRRGATSVNKDINAWTAVSLLLLVGHLLVPFAGLLSRHVKRSRKALVFWAAWMLVFHWLDLHWIVMPEMDGRFHLGWMELACFVGIGGIYAASLLRIAVLHSLRPTADPRLGESLEFENI